MPPKLTTDPTLGTTSSVGRYFGLVSTLPSVVLAAWLYLLVTGGAFEASGPSRGALEDLGPQHHPGAAMAAVAAALALAVVTHPIQFTVVQLMEGYWGSGRAARAAREWFTVRQLRTVAAAARLREEADHAKRDLPTGKSTRQYVSVMTLRDEPVQVRAALHWQGLLDATADFEQRLPDPPLHAMPTRLGNTLRKHEIAAGRAVELPLINWATHIGMVARPEHGAYIADQRTQLDMAVRISAMGAIATLLTFGCLWDDRGSVFVTLIPYFVTWISYRGAIVSADSYGLALRAWVDLNRFRLYKELGLPRLTTTGEERQQNIALDDLRIGSQLYESVLDPDRDSD